MRFDARPRSRLAHSSAADRQMNFRDAWVSSSDDPLPMLWRRFATPQHRHVSLAEMRQTRQRFEAVVVDSRVELCDLCVLCV